MALIILAAIILLLVFILKPYFVKYDNVILYTGTLGSGKTFCAVKTALKTLKRNRTKVFFYNLFHKDKRPRPMLYSNVPVKVSSSEYSLQLKPEHFTMAEAIIPRSVVLTDEISLMLSQMDYKTVNDEALSDFCTLFRQYTLGGTWVLTTQNVKKCHHSIRRVLDSAFRLSEFRAYFRLVYKVQVRHIDICEDTININDGHSEDATSRIIGLIGRRKYDTHCYYPRYARVPFGLKIRHKALRTKKLCKIPVKTKLPCYLDTGDDA